MEAGVAAIKTVPRGWAHCNICKQFYPLTQKHICKALFEKQKKE